MMEYEEPSDLTNEVARKFTNKELLVLILMELRKLNTSLGENTNNAENCRTTGSRENHLKACG